MFNSARLKLTAWYLLIIAFISFLFSFTIYRFLNNEIDRFSEAQKLRLERRIERRFPDEVIRRFPAPPPDFSDPDIVKETKFRIIIALLGVNGGVLVISGFLSYFLSGKTLQPIKEVFEKQDRFISDASHELRTPLTSLKTSIEISLRDKNLNVDEAKRVLKENLTDVDSLSNLTSSLLELSVNKPQKELLSCQIVSSKDLLSQAIHNVMPQAKSKKITITKKTGHTKLFVDKEKIVRVLLIVLDNAIKYSPSESKISIHTSKSRKHFTFHVKDRGIGISQEDKEKIFDRFYRADKSRTKSTTHGFGLGLAIAKEIISLHQGNIVVSSKLGEGSTFNIVLPLQKKSQTFS